MRITKPSPCIRLGSSALLLTSTGCLGLHAGALYDHSQHVVKPMIGVSLEAFGPLDTDKPTYGARTGVLYPFGGTARVSLQPEANLPVTRGYGNVTLAAGIASGPFAFHSTACFRQLEGLNYGACGHWFSDGSYGADFNLSFFFPILFADFGHVY